MIKDRFSIGGHENDFQQSLQCRRNRMLWWDFRVEFRLLCVVKSVHEFSVPDKVVQEGAWVPLSIDVTKQADGETMSTTTMSRKSNHSHETSKCERGDEG